MMSKKTMFEKIWENHVIHQEEGKPSILYIDLHLVHEVTSPQAFEGLRLSGRKVRRPELTFATMDHNVPTKDRFNITDPISKQQIDTLSQNCRDFGVKLYDLDTIDQGVVHVMGPELGLTHPGKTIVCGDSHTSTHGAFGALAFGIGTSEVEHVMATQCLQQAKAKTMEVRFVGKRNPGVTAKDMILAVIAKYGTDFATGYVIEYTGESIRELSMEERMTVCNMSIEGGARAGLIAPDETTFEYLRGREYVPAGAKFDEAVAGWKQLVTDEGAEFDHVVEIDVETLIPQVTWGTSQVWEPTFLRKFLFRLNCLQKTNAKRLKKRLNIWDLNREHQSPRFQLIMYLSVLARMVGSKICVQQQKWLKVTRYPVRLQQLLYQVQDVLKFRLNKKVWIKSLQKLDLNGVMRDAACVWR